MLPDKQLCRCSCCGTFQSVVRNFFAQTEHNSTPLARCTSCGQYLSASDPPPPQRSNAPSDGVHYPTPIRRSNEGDSAHHSGTPRTWGATSNSTWWWCSPSPRRHTEATEVADHEAASAATHPSIPGSTVAVVSSPSIVFRGRAGSQRAPLPDTDIPSPEQRAFAGTVQAPPSRAALRRSTAAGVSSVDKVLQVLRPMKTRPDATERHCRPAADEQRASPAPFQDGTAQKAGMVSAAAISMTRSLLALTNRRLTQRYYNHWLIVARSKLPKSVIKMRRGLTSASPGGGASSRAEWSVTRSSVSPTRPTNEVLHSAVTALWKAHEDHAACVKAVLDRLVTTPDGDEVATPFYDTRPTATEGSPLPARRSSQSTTGNSRTSVKELSSFVADATTDEPSRPLAALIRMQGAHAVTYLHRNEEVSRRRLLQAEAEDRDLLELDFHTEREACANTGGSVSNGSRRIAAVDVLASFDQQLESAKRDVAASSPSPTRPAQGGATATGRNSAAADAAVLAAREANARKLLTAAQSNAWVTVLATLETEYREARQQDAERAIVRREASAAYGAKLSSAAAVTRPALASPSAAAAVAAASSPSSSSSPLSLRQRSATMMRLATTTESPSSPMTSVAPVDVEPGAPAISAAPLRAERTAVNVSSDGSPRDARIHRSQTVVLGSPKFAPSAAQEVMVANPVVAQIFADELRGRKQVIKSYKEGMTEIISFFANRAAAL